MRRSPLLLLALAPILLPAVTEGRLRTGDGAELSEKDIQGLFEGSESKNRIRSLMAFIKMIIDRRDRVESESRRKIHGAKNLFEMKMAPFIGNDAQKRSKPESYESVLGVPSFKHKRQSHDKNMDDKGEHLNPTDFSNADKIAKNSDRPKGGHDPIENRDGAGQPVIEGDIVHHERQPRNMIVNPDEKWSRGEIPYVIASGFSSRERATIAKAVLEFERNTCIHVRPLAPNDNASNGYVKIIKGDGCYSSVGRQSSPGQELSLGNGCIYPGIVVHEFMHALGFWHEQSRPDRDNHIRIHYNNIQAGMSYNFKKYTTSQVQLLGTAYDVGSVMHYGPYAFARDRSRPTITALQQTSVTMGQREGLSREDINKINKLYKCKDVTAPPPPIVQPEECTDKNMYCKDWAGSGECTKNPLYMKMQCAKSCNTCSSGSCQDLNKYCAAWAETGECTKTPSYMSLYCKQSCGLCQGGGGIACSDGNQYCEPWADQGECQKNPDYMKVNCRKACGLCRG